eukprot:14977862-Heterocapsa_arctica.AAC.1
MAISDSLQSVHKQIAEQLNLSFQLCEKNLSAALDLRLCEVANKLEQNESKQKERDEYMIQEHMKMNKRLDSVEAK